MSAKSPASRPERGAPPRLQVDHPPQKPGLSAWPARIALVILGMVIGQWHASQPRVEAQTRKVEAPQAFLSGSERCEIILKDIHKTLQTMDQRLLTLEQASQVLVNKK